MPAAAAAWVTNALIVGTTVSVGTIAALSWTTYAVTALAMTAGLAKISAALMGRPKLGAGMQSRKMVIRGSTEPRSIIYGKVRTAGVLVFVGTAGTKNEYLDFVIAVAGHEVNSIEDVWFDNEKIAEADINSGNAAGGVVGGSNKYANRAWIYKYLGTDSQTASSTLDTDYGEWSSSHRLRGCAYVHIRLRRDNDVYESGPPSNFTFLVEGAKVYDPRLDTTQSGGSGSHRVTDPSTWAYSNNPALCCADYLIGGTIVNTATRTNLRGFGADPADVDWASIMSAANSCDETVSIPPASPSTTQKRYECDGVLSMGEVCSENLEQLLSSMVGQMTPPGGKYKLFAGVYPNSTITLTESDLAAGYQYTTATPRADLYNAVKGSRYDNVSGQDVEFVPKTNGTYEGYDNSVRLYRDIELPFTVDEYRAQRIATLILNRSREQKVLVFPGNLGCLRVGTWETVAVTLSELGMVDKTFRCISRSYNPGADGGEPMVVLTLREEQPATYAAPAVGDYGSINSATPTLFVKDLYVDPSKISIVPDPLMQFGVDGGALDLWAHTANVTYQDTDVAQIVMDGASAPATIRTAAGKGDSVRKNFFGKWGIYVSVRWRVTAALSGATKRMTLYVFASDKAFTGGGGASYSMVIDMSTAVTNTWYVASNILNWEDGGPSYNWCYVMLSVADTEVTGGTIEIDTFEAYALPRA